MSKELLGLTDLIEKNYGQLVPEKFLLSTTIWLVFCGYLLAICRDAGNGSARTAELG